jgi:hypothetical protein
MEPVLKLILFAIVFFAMVIGFFKSYKYYNEKIIGAGSGWSLLGFALLLILTCALLFVGGLYLLITVFVFLSEQG